MHILYNQFSDIVFSEFFVDVTRQPEGNIAPTYVMGWYGKSPIIKATPTNEFDSLHGKFFTQYDVSVEVGSYGIPIELLVGLFSYEWYPKALINAQNKNLGFSIGVIPTMKQIIYDPQSWSSQKYTRLTTVNPFWNWYEFNLAQIRATNTNFPVYSFTKKFGLTWSMKITRNISDFNFIFTRSFSKPYQYYNNNVYTPNILSAVNYLPIIVDDEANDYKRDYPFYKIVSFSETDDFRYIKEESLTIQTINTDKNIYGQEQIAGIEVILDFTMFSTQGATFGWHLGDIVGNRTVTIEQIGTGWKINLIFNQLQQISESEADNLTNVVKKKLYGKYYIQNIAKSFDLSNKIINFYFNK